MNVPHLLELLLLGAGLGFAGGLFGIGGGIIAIPVLVIGFGVDQAVAQGTALVLMVPNLLLAWWRYCQHNPLPWRDILGVSLTGTVATWLAAQVANHIDQQLLRSLCALFLLVVAVDMIRGRRSQAEVASAADPAGKRPLLALIGAIGGGCMGLLGIGGGLVATPLFARFLKLGQRTAQSFGLSLATPSAVIALGAYGAHGHVNWPLGLILAIGGLFTVAPGVALAHRLPEHRLQACFGVMLAAASLWLLLGRYILS